MGTFKYSSWINAPVETVFAFHRRADALEKLTPPGQRVTVLRREGGLEAGARVELLLRFGPFSKKWIALHTAYEENRLFEDVQLEGPFKSWRHRHAFAAEGRGARLTDSIDFELPGGRLADFVAGWLVVRQLEKMFAFRHEVTRRECEKANRRSQ